MSSDSSNVLDVSIVVPVYNNAESLPVLISQIQDEMTLNNPELSYELILIDDGSSDLSWNVISSYTEKEIVAIKLTRNFGQLGAMKAGYSNAIGRCLISISSDLQDPTTLITKMIASWKRGYDLVLCERSSRDDKRIIKLTSKIAYYFLAKEINDIPRGGFDVFLFSSNLRDSILSLKGRYNFLQGDLLFFGYKFEVIKYHRKKRSFGKSGYTFKKRLKNFQDALLDSNYTLVDFFFKVGSAISLLGFILGLLILIGKILGKSPFNGFTVIACSILFIGGIQIMLTGLIGQYIARIYDASREKPAFHIEKISRELPTKIS